MELNEAIDISQMKGIQLLCLFCELLKMVKIEPRLKSLLSFSVALWKTPGYICMCISFVIVSFLSRHPFP